MLEIPVTYWCVEGSIADTTYIWTQIGQIEDSSLSQGHVHAALTRVSSTSVALKLGQRWHRFDSSVRVYNIISFLWAHLAWSISNRWRHMVFKVLLDAVKKFIYLVKFVLVHLRLFQSLLLRLLLNNRPELLYLGILLSNYSMQALDFFFIFIHRHPFWCSFLQQSARFQIVLQRILLIADSASQGADGVLLWDALSILVYH